MGVDRFARVCYRFHAGWTIHGGMPNVGKDTREAVAVSWVPGQTKMLPAFDVVGQYSSDDKMTIQKLLTLQPGDEVPDEMLPTVWSPAEELPEEAGEDAGTKKQEL